MLVFQISDLSVCCLSTFGACGLVVLANFRIAGAGPTRAHFMNIITTVEKHQLQRHALWDKNLSSISPSSGIDLIRMPIQNSTLHQKITNMWTPGYRQAIRRLFSKYTTFTTRILLESDLLDTSNFTIPPKML